MWEGLIEGPYCFMVMCHYVVAVGSGVQGLVLAGLGLKDRSLLDKALDFTQHQLPASKCPNCCDSLWHLISTTLILAFQISLGLILALL